MTFEEELTNFSSLPAVRLITYTEQDVHLTGLPESLILGNNAASHTGCPMTPVKQPVLTTSRSDTNSLVDVVRNIRKVLDGPMGDCCSLDDNRELQD